MGRAGFVLVGGRSSRMGRDKALLPHNGATLVEHIAAQVVAADGSVTLVGAPERYAHLGLPVIADSVSGFGPVAGIQAALATTREDWNLIVACDMPSISADFLRSLFAAAERCGADCLVPRSPSGRLEPLCAVYHRNCLAGINSAVREGVRKVQDAISRLRVSEWHVSESAWFRNLNTPEDIHA